MTNFDLLSKNITNFDLFGLILTKFLANITNSDLLFWQIWLILHYVFANMTNFDLFFDKYD